MNIVKMHSRILLTAMLTLVTLALGISLSLVEASTPTTTTTTTATTLAPGICYRLTADGSGYTTEISYTGCSYGSMSRPPMDCPNGTLSIGYEYSWVCTIHCADGSTVSSIFGTPSCPSTTPTTIGTNTTTTSVTPTTQISYVICYYPDGTAFISPYSCPPGSSLTTSTTSTTTSTASTTTTTLCHTYVNGTTQYPYSGNGSCHSFANDDVTGGHIVRDQSYCKKHMKRFNSKGNHVHAYPHPVCM